jgi:hypothetical protein
MIALTGYPAFWGACGGLVFGLLGLIPAFSSKGNPAARRDALVQLAIGVVAAPLVAEAFTGMVLALMPALAMRAVAMTIGALTVPYGPEFVDLIKRLISKRLGDQP